MHSTFHRVGLRVGAGIATSDDRHDTQARPGVQPPSQQAARGPAPRPGAGAAGQCHVVAAPRQSCWPLTQSGAQHALKRTALVAVTPTIIVAARENSSKQPRQTLLPNDHLGTPGPNPEPRRFRSANPPSGPRGSPGHRQKRLKGASLGRNEEHNRFVDPWSAPPNARLAAPPGPPPNGPRTQRRAICSPHHVGCQCRGHHKEASSAQFWPDPPTPCPDPPHLKTSSKHPSSQRLWQQRPPVVHRGSSALENQ